MSYQLQQLKKIDQEIAEIEKMLEEEKDEEILELAREDLARLEKERKILGKKLKETEKDSLAKKNIIIEIRAGTGGEEAALFAADLLRMYSRFAEKKKWKTHLISSARTGIGGMKEAILEIDGADVYKILKNEAGTHRVQRIPETEKSGRIHTSAATVAVLPKAEPVDIKINPQDLKIDTFRASGHGGQYVQKTSSAVRITHMPTGLVAACQDERSQQQNKEKALTILRSRLLAIREEKKQKEIKEKRRAQVGTGDRSEKIRTYNFPQNRVTDHRIKKSWHDIQGIMDGNLDKIVKALK